MVIIVVGAYGVHTRVMKKDPKDLRLGCIK